MVHKLLRVVFGLGELLRFETMLPLSRCGACSLWLLCLALKAIRQPCGAGLCSSGTCGVGVLGPAGQKVDLCAGGHCGGLR